MFIVVKDHDLVDVIQRLDVEGVEAFVDHVHFQIGNEESKRLLTLRHEKRVERDLRVLVDENLLAIAHKLAHEQRIERVDNHHVCVQLGDHHVRVARLRRSLAGFVREIGDELVAVLIDEGTVGACCELVLHEELVQRIARDETVADQRFLLLEVPAQLRDNERLELCIVGPLVQAARQLDVMLGEVGKVLCQRLVDQAQREDADVLRIVRAHVPDGELVLAARPRHVQDRRIGRVVREREVVR